MTTTWVYLRSEPGLWTVGYYAPGGRWHPESDHRSEADAAKRVAYLNGDHGDLIDQMAQFLRRLMAAHRAQLPSETQDLYGGGCGCPQCQDARRLLGLMTE